MTKCDINFPLPLPDDPRKWQGWNNYRSPNFYERLCLDPHANPSNELIEEHCRELMRWWQKKLPLKNQPSNPLAQLLRSGLEESSRFLTEARLELLDPERRQALDEELAAGTLAEVAGEPVIVQPVDEASFERTRFVFFTGSPAFAAAHARSAQRAGATVIDMTGSLSAAPGARLWIPHLDAELAAPPSGHADSQAPIAAPPGTTSSTMSSAAGNPAASESRRMRWSKRSEPSRGPARCRK